MTYNKIYVEIGDERRITLQPISYQYDVRQVLVITGAEGVELPAFFTVDFCNVGDEETEPIAGSASGVLIPDGLLLTGKNIMAYFVIAGPDTAVQTRYEITIPVNSRPVGADVDPTEDQQRQIDALMATLNEGIDAAEAAQAAAEASAEDAEAWAVGERDGVPVTSEDETYHNSSKYHAEQAAASASDAQAAQTAAETAQGKAEDAQTAAESAQTAAETAQGKAEDAQTAAEGAQTAAETAQGKAEDAQTAAEGAQTAAETAQGKAEDAQIAAEGAQTAAETAKGKAEDAQGAAEAAKTAADADALKAEGWAVGKQNGADVSSGSLYYHNSAAYHAGQASGSASTASDKAGEASGSASAAAADALKAEGWAVGKQNGADVGSGSPYYHDSASYHAGQAAGSASAAADSATAAAGSAAAAQTAALGENFADEYDSTATYADGEYCIYSNVLYKCISAIETAEAWTAAHWEAVTVGEELSDLNNALKSGAEEDAEYHLGFYLDENGDLCQVDDE